MDTDFDSGITSMAFLLERSPDPEWPPPGANPEVLFYPQIEREREDRGEEKEEEDEDDDEQR